MLTIDGSQGEGGGQIRRSSLALSILTGTPVRIENIRARREKPGLQPQHLMSVKAAGAICGALFKGAAIGSTSLYFEPKDVRAGKYHFTIGTAGATGLVLQTVHLPLALRGEGPSEVVIDGGTHVPMSPCFHFLETTWAAYLRKMGFAIELEMVRPGFYPRGGGQIRAVIQPCREVKPLHLMTCPELTTASGFSAVAGGLPADIARRQARRLSERLKRVDVESHVRLEEWGEAAGEDGGKKRRTHEGRKLFQSPGTIAAVTFLQAPVPTSFFAIGERGKPAESVADDAADEAIRFRESKCPVDPHSADQIVLPLAFAVGASEYRTSDVDKHLPTHIDILKLFLDREITLEGGIVRIAGSVLK
jgi:RNA 3'-terminal phosphate cyclase (ATP)